MRIACVSDVCLGYGSPQIGQLVRSLSEWYQAENLVVEPRHPDLPPRHHLFPGLRIVRARNASSPYSEAGRVEYLVEAARLVEDYSPDLLVICCTFSLPVLFKLSRRPAYVIYYCYESIPAYGAFDEEMNWHLDGMVDLVVFPEENRAFREAKRFGFRQVPKVILYNCPDRDPEEVERGFLPERNGRTIHSGTLDGEMTMADYYTRSEVQQYPIDLYGGIRGTAEDRRGFLARLGGGVQYRGMVDSRELAALRKHYAWSLVIWNPCTENQLYAAPNKFFESIADGVPPVAAPHPQCKMLIERYQCGLLMADWSYTAFCHALRRAARLYRDGRWAEMVARCGQAARQELTWKHQFEKLKYYLKER